MFKYKSDVLGKLQTQSGLLKSIDYERVKIINES
jgi:hypothetical protein